MFFSHSLLTCLSPEFDGIHELKPFDPLAVGGRMCKIVYENVILSERGNLEASVSNILMRKTSFAFGHERAA